jgi:hypothetical protein
MTSAHLFVLHLTPELSEHCPIRRLRAGLKHLLRSHGLRCVHAADAIGRPIDQAEHGSGDPVAMARALARTFRHLAAMLDGADIPPDAADDLAVCLASLATQADALQHRLYASLPRPDGTSRRSGRPRQQKPPAGL